jgi:hypothetical protein
MSTKLKSLIQQIIKEEVALFEKKKKKDELPPLDVDVDVDAEVDVIKGDVDIVVVDKYISSFLMLFITTVIIHSKVTLYLRIKLL